MKVGLAVSVKPILPNNQHNPEATYYDLRMEPNQEQDLALELINTSDKKQQVTLQINDATTNEIGDIDYSDRSKIVVRDKSLKFGLKDIASSESEITIPAHETMTTIVHLKMPPNQFNGMILGGIKVVSSEKSNGEQTSTNQQDHAPKTYIVAVKLTETDTPITANLNLLGVFSVKESKKNSIKATIQNDQAINLEDIELTAKVYEENSDKLSFQTKLTGYRMAPNSSLTFIINKENQVLQPGNYQIAIAAKSKATNQEWQWDEELRITQAEDKEKDNLAMSKESIMFYTIIFVSTFVALLLLLLILLILRKRKEKRYAEALYHKNKEREPNNKNPKRKRKSEGNKSDSVRRRRSAESKRQRKSTPNK
ncbi:hypothetical protein RV15_GL001816 [Enterococcus silesiacus]|nr:hypothetical protein RV15_GL001816 [Enterococcus silesiacus]